MSRLALCTSFGSPRPWTQISQLHPPPPQHCRARLPPITEAWWSPSNWTRSRLVHLGWMWTRLHSLLTSTGERFWQHETERKKHFHYKLFSFHLSKPFACSTSGNQRLRKRARETHQFPSRGEPAHQENRNSNSNFKHHKISVWTRTEVPHGNVALRIAPDGVANRSYNILESFLFFSPSELVWYKPANFGVASYFSQIFFFFF